MASVLAAATSDTWNTPASFLDLVRQVLGAIDVDPASNDAAQAVVQASTFYTLETNGLAHAWPGRVYLNPPYSNVAPFVSKLLHEIDEGCATEAIVLVNARTGAKWFQALAARAWRCEIQKRVRFWRPERPEGSAGRSSSVAFYLGPNPERFAATFRRHGLVTPPAVIRDCAACGEPIDRARADAVTCSARCRKRLERSRKRLRAA